MNQADLGPNPAANTPLIPGPQQNEASPGTSAFAVLVAISFLLMTAFFVMSFWAVWTRSEKRTTQMTSTVIEDRSIPPSPILPDPEIWLDAMVNIKRQNQGPGKLRGSPNFNGAYVADFDHGSSVKVAQSSVKNHEKWYRVKGIYKGAVVEGYMHSDILIVVPSQ